MSFKNQLQVIRKRNQTNAVGIRTRQQYSIERVLGGSYAQNFLAQFGNGGDLSRIEDQLSHFRGYTFAIIRTIANTIAHQKMKVASLSHDVGYSEGKARGRLLSDFQKKHFIPNCGKAVEETNAFILESHKILDTFEHPNPIQTQYVLQFMTICNLELTGMAFWIMLDETETKSGKSEIWGFPVSWFEPVHTDEKLFSSWLVRPEGFGTPVEFPAEKVIYFYYPDPANPLRAKSPLSALAESVLADESIEISNRKAFENGCNPGLALIVGRPPEMGAGGVTDDRPYLTAQQREQIIASVTAHYRGVLNSDEPLILDGLIRDAKRISNSPREMDFLNSGQTTKNRLAQGWGVNPIVMGDFQNANRAAAVAADESFINLVVNPRLTMISQVLTMTLGERWGEGEDLIVYIEKAKSQDIEFDLKVEDSLTRAGAIGRNELRARHGLEPIEDGDSCFVPGIGEIPILKVAKPEQKNLILASDMNTQKTMAQMMGDRLQASMWLRQLMRLKYDYEHALRNHFILMGESLRHRAQLSFKASTVITDTAISQLVDESNLLEELKNVSRPYIQKMALTGAMLEWTIHTQKGFDMGRLGRKGWLDSLTGLPKKIVDSVGGFVGNILNYDYWAGMVQTTKDEMNTGLKDASEKGETGTRAIDAALSHALNASRSFKRADSIAEGESVTAINGGQNTTRVELATVGIVGRKKWWTMGDARVRESHRKAHGQIVGINEKFTLELDEPNGIVGLYECDFPGDPSLPPAARCRCRCTAISL